MNLLAFDTSSEASSAALLHHEVVKVVDQVAPMQQAKQLLPLIKTLLESNSLILKDLDAIAYGCGPGSFTGIRIASCVAQALGFVAEKPIIQISSLAAMAEGAYLSHQWKNVLVAVDARMGQIYWAVYRISQGHMELEGEEHICDPHKITLPIEKDAVWYGIGDGWAKYENNLTSTLGFKPKDINSAYIPKAAALIELAKVKYEQQDFIAASEALPDYLR